MRGIKCSLGYGGVKSTDTCRYISGSVTPLAHIKCMHPLLPSIRTWVGRERRVQCRSSLATSLCNAICLLCFLLYTQNLKVLKYVGDDKKAEWARYWIERGLQG